MAFGHPKGLFPLFFTEMWERLAFYTMVGILLLYTTDTERGGLGLPAQQGNEIYGLYLAFVYFTPFIGGMIADRFLGYRRAVALGGLLMGGGLLLMGVPGFTYFVLGLIGLIVGNGFFKPNISVMVGNLYEPGDPRRDAGFNIFYMGINIGALLATLLVAPLMRNVFGWLWTFRAAGIGVLLAVVILATQWRILAHADRQPEHSEEDMGFGAVLAKIILPAFAVGLAGYFFARQVGMSVVSPSDFGFLVGSIPVLLFFVVLALKAREEERPGLLALLPIFVAGGAFFMILHLNGSAMTQWARDETDRQVGGVTRALTWTHQEALPRYYINAAEDVPRPDPRTLLVVEDARVAAMYGQQRLDEEAVRAIAATGEVRVEEIGEGAQGPLARRAAAVYASGTVTVEETADAHGVRSISVSVPDGAEALRQVAFVREVEGRPMAVFVVDAHTYESIYEGYRRLYGKEPALLPPGEFLTVVSPEVYQSWNPFFVILLTPVVVAFFAWRVKRGKPVPTAHKLLYGILLTAAALAFMALAGLMTRSGTVKVSGFYLATFYMIVTLGELCLSPMGLSLVTKLTPRRLVGLAMGGWFLATAIGNKFSGFFGTIQGLMDPLYFFLLLSGVSALVALFLFLVLSRLDRAIRRYGA
ncbi:MAG: peptide MFS transporter [Acidobacteriota bacterium]|nr:peptide MFS transporter [Acidobacteriota bacterium]